jgi:hypothetical protein
MANLVEASKQEQLMMLRDLTRRMEVLHDAQVLQLKMWPRTLFEVKPPEIGVDFATKTVHYTLKSLKKPKVYGDAKKRCLVMIGWIKWLLGDDWTVTITLDGKQLNGKRAKPKQKARRKPNARRARRV